jgi:hypothetical protein
MEVNDQATLIGLVFGSLLLGSPSDLGVERRRVRIWPKTCDVKHRFEIPLLRIVTPVIFCLKVNA